jgi:hypothetical protein
LAASPRSGGPDAGTASDAGRRSSDGGRTIDVKQTERGQPATRNYME